MNNYDTTLFQVLGLLQNANEEVLGAIKQAQEEYEKKLEISPSAL